MKLSKSIVSAALALSASVAAAPASAQVVQTFATFSPSDDGANVAWDYDGVTSGGGTFTSTASATSLVPGTQSVLFSFLLPELTSINNVTASFSLNSSAPAGNLTGTGGSFLTQGGVTGGFAFISTQAVTIGDTTFAAGSNLLTALFSNAVIFGAQNGSSASFSATQGSSQSVSFISDFFNASALVGDQQFAFNLASITDPLAAAPGDSALRDFTAVASGSLSSGFSDPVAAVPEPGTWAMMIIGFGFVGGTLRYRRRKMVFATA